MNDFRKGPLWILTVTVVGAAATLIYYYIEEHKAKMRAADLSYKMQRQMYEQMTVSTMEQGLNGT